MNFVATVIIATIESGFVVHSYWVDWADNLIRRSSKPAERWLINVSLSTSEEELRAALDDKLLDEFSLGANLDEFTIGFLYTMFKEGRLSRDGMLTNVAWQVDGSAVRGLDPEMVYSALNCSDDASGEHASLSGLFELLDRLSVKSRQFLSSTIGTDKLE